MIHDPRLDEYATAWEGAAMTPLRITLHTHRAVAGYDMPHLDSILARAVVDVATGGRGLASSHGEPYWLPVPLRCLWRDPASGLPLWASTDFAPEGAQHTGTATWIRTEMPPTLVRRSKQGRAYAPRITQGPEKLMQTPLPVRLADAWTCDVVGAESWVGTLLATMDHIGKKRAQGWGLVANWEITPIDAFSFVDTDGRLRRPMPAAAVTPGTLWASAAVLGWTSPYYAGIAGTQALCYPPGAVIDPVHLPGGAV